MPSRPQMPTKKRPASFFKRTALATAFYLAAGCAGFDLTPSPSSIPLTKGEAELAHGIFGDEIKTNTIQKHFYSKPHKDNIAARVVDVSTIEFFGDKYHSADYSREKDGFKYGTFPHELTHIMELQKNPVILSSYDQHEYYYTLTPQSRYADFGFEQKAALIEDYTRRFFYPGLPSRHHTGKTLWSVPDTPESDILMQKVVEERFPQAQKTRLSLEAQRQHAKAEEPHKLAKLRLKSAP